MKKIVFATILMAVYGVVTAQTPEDALTFSRPTPASGTARVQALGGASGALGGEISTIFSNPANIGFYKTGDVVLTAGFKANNNKGTYFGRTEQANSSNAFLGTSGFVWGRASYNGSLKGAAFGLAINRTADFGNKLYYLGQNKVGSMGQMFVEDINAYGSRDQFGSDLAFRTYWVDTTSGGTYYSPAQNLINSGGGLIQEQTTITSGGITEFAIAGGANINDNIYLGASVGLPTLRYSRTRQFTEADATNSTTNKFDYGYFENDLETRGAGINLKAGVVIAPNPNIRIGLAAHSPTFYSLTDRYSAYAEAMTENLTPNAGKRSASSSDGYNNDGVLVSDYNLQTPYKLMGSFTVLLGNLADVRTQKGLITADVEYMNYMASKFTSSENNYANYFSKLNKAIDNAYQGVLNARVGAELKFNTFMARFGGAYYGNPYKDIAGEKSNIYQGTAGIGYRNRGFFIDLGYVHTFGSETNFPYRLESRSAFQAATIKPSDARVILTLGFKI